MIPALTVIHSFDLRDQANDLIDKATQIMIKALELPPINKFAVEQFEPKANYNNFSAKLSQIDERLDASYHIPIIDAITEHLQRHADEITTIGDERISSDVVLPGRFKRVYVDDMFGVRFIGGKELGQLNPDTGKYLSSKVHKKQLAGSLGIKEYSILTPARGSLGTVVLPCKHFYNWAISDNIMQILSNKDFCGFLFVFLNSDYGKVLIKRNTYGGVVDAIEPFHIKNVIVPIIRKNNIQKQINDLALEANKKRYEAYELEQDALRIMDEEVIYAK